MRRFREIFALEFKALARSKTLGMLLVASVLWMLLFPYVVKGDGTDSGAHELYVHFSLGGVFVLLVVALLASATGSLARERTARRLQLTMVRPVRYFTIVFGKILAHVSVGAIVLLASCAVLPFRVDMSRRCDHVLSPVLPSPREEAKAMYDEYMKDPATPERVRKTRKDIVLRLLTQRAVDHYQVLPTNAVTSWKFALPPDAPHETSLAVRMRFTNQYEMRQDVRGAFSMGECRGVVSNMTQAVLTIPLSAGVPGRELSFDNQGKSSLMLRPRKDVNLLVRADSFGMNLLRSYLMLVAILALVVSLGTCLSAGLGRPVALFVAFVMLIVSEMSPSVVESYPDALETKAVDRIGLAVTRFVAEVTQPVSSVSPLEALAKDECVEGKTVLRLVLLDLVAAPLLLSLLSAFVLPRKQEDVE